MTKSFALISMFALSTLSSAVLGGYVTTGEQEAIPPINTEGHRVSNSAEMYNSHKITYEMIKLLKFI